MTLTLNPALEQQIQTELELGGFREPGEVIAHALDLLKIEREELAADRTELDLLLDERMAEFERGEVMDGEAVRAMIHQSLADAETDAAG